jgi:hypothetical protein
MITTEELAAALALMLADPQTVIATRRAVVIAAWLAQQGVEV